MRIQNFGYADWRGNQYDTFCKTTESIAYNRGILARRFTNQNSGEVITVFCAEHTEDFIPNSVNTGIAFVPTDEKVKKACKVAYLGWYKKYNNLVFTMEEFESPENYIMQKDYAFTQQLIWETLEQSNARFLDDNIQKEYEHFRINILKKSEEIEQRPSFNAKTINLDAGVEKIITDENNILKEYSSIDKEVNGVRLIHNLGENNLKIKALENCNINQINLSEDVLKNLGLIKEETKNNNTSIYFEFSSGIQNQIYSLNYNSPVSLSLNLQVTPYGNLELKKVNNEGNLIDGAKFEISGPENYKKEVTVKKGIIKLERLKIGTYTIKEKTAPFGYLLDTKSYNIEVKTNQTTTQAIINNEPTGEIKVYKTDDYNNKLKGAEISLYTRQDIKNVAGTKTWHKKGDLVARAITNEQGVATFSNLHLGHYYVKETNAPNGYLLNTKEFDAELNYKNQTTKVIYLDINGIINEKPIGTIKLDKTIALRENINTSLIDTSDLSCIEFNLLAKEDIIDKRDGSKIYKKGQEIKKYNLTKDGKLTITDLPIGVYEIVETKTLDGLVLNKSKYEVKFEQKDLTTKDYIEKINISNDATLVEFSKTDIMGDKELKGAKLFVLDSDNNIIDEWITTDKTHIIEGLKIGKEYILREKIAPDGYVKATSVKFTIDDTNKIQKVNMIDKIVEISKEDILGKEIDGAKLQVLDVDGNVIDKWISSNETHQVKGLEEGKTYILKEITAPYGYEITEEIQFVVTTDKDIQKIEMKDMPILKNVKIVKIDSETKETIKDKFIFGIYEDTECTKKIKNIKSNKDEGAILFDNLKFGTYYIKEIEAPNGYLISNEKIKLEINDKGTFANGKKVEEKDGIYNIEFLNNKIPIIQTKPKIQTSDELNISVWTTCLVSSFVVAIIIVFLAIKDKNKQKNLYR